MTPEELITLGKLGAEALSEDGDPGPDWGFIRRAVERGKELLDQKPVCAEPMTQGPNKGQTATGTRAGYQRHRYYGEEPCEACKEANIKRQKELVQKRKGGVTAREDAGKNGGSRA